QAGQSQAGFRAESLAWQRRVTMANWNLIVEEAVRAAAPSGFEIDRRAALALVDGGERHRLRDLFVADPGLLGQRGPDELLAGGAIDFKFAWHIFTNVDSRSAPASAGLAGALVGSLYMMVIVVLLAVPIGVASAIYLEEFAPKNRLTDLIEVNINNLAAVPSIVFGLFGAAVFIKYSGLPISAPIVGGLVLTLMTLPTIIIATRSSL